MNDIKDPLSDDHESLISLVYETYKDLTAKEIKPISPYKEFWMLDIIEQICEYRDNGSSPQEYRDKIMSLTSNAVQKIKSPELRDILLNGPK